MEYKISLPKHLRIHNVFHISLLKKYVYDSAHIIDWNVVQVEPEGEFQVEHVCILERKETIPRNWVLTRVKVQWKHFILEEATWELEDFLWKKYPGILPGTMEDDWEHCGQCYNKGERM